MRQVRSFYITIIFNLIYFFLHAQDIQEINSLNFRILVIQVKWIHIQPYVILQAAINLRKLLSGHHCHFITHRWMAIDLELKFIHEILV